MRDPRLAPFRGPALVFAAFLALQAATGAVLYAEKLGATPSRIATYYRGDEARFVPAKSVDGLLLVAVPHLLAIPLVIFAAAHVVAWARAIGARAGRAAVALSFAAALAGVAAPFLTRFGGAGFAWLKVASFAALSAALLGWAALLVVVFLPRRAGVSEPVRERAAPAVLEESS